MIQQPSISAGLRVNQVWVELGFSTGKELGMPTLIPQRLQKPGLPWLAQPWQGLDWPGLECGDGLDTAGAEGLVTAVLAGQHQCRAVWDCD